MKNLIIRITGVLLSAMLIFPSLMAFADDNESEEQEFFSLINTQLTGLSDAVETGKTTGDWTAAKEQLLTYYTEKFAGIDWVKPYTTYDGSASTLIYDTLSFSEPYLTKADVTTEEKEISISVGARSAYLLTAFVHSDIAGIRMVSSEGDSSKAPKLIVSCSDGSTVELTASEDAYVRATGYGKTNNNSTTKYGVEDEKNLWACHRADVENRMPYSDDEMRTYIKFDLTKLNGKTASGATLKITAQVKAVGSAKIPADTTLPLFVMAPYLSDFSESTITWKYLQSQNALAHYSWNGLGGFIIDEKLYGKNYSNLYVPSQYISYFSRFYELTSLCRAGYLEKAREFLLSYADQTYDLIKTAYKTTGNFPVGHPIGSANRLIEFPYIYQTLLRNGLLTPEDNYKILRWLYQDIQAVYKEKSNTIFVKGSATPNTTTNYYKDNFGPWHISAFYNTFAFWGEFNEAADWEKMFGARLDVLSELLTYDDGSYVEVTFGYPVAVMGLYSTMIGYMLHADYHSKASDRILNKLINVVKYLMDCSYPDTTLPQYGDGGVQRIPSIIDNLLKIEEIEKADNENLQNLIWYNTRTGGTKPERLAFYEDAKLLTDRTGWTNGDSMIFINAKSGGVHHHMDSLSLLFYAFEKNFLIDPGTYTYDDKSPAYVLRDTKSHNTVEVDGISQRGKGTYISEGYDGNEQNIVFSSNENATFINAYTTSNKNAVHYRNVAYLKQYDSLLVVNDLLVPNDTSSHTYTQNWHTLADANPAVTSKIGNFDDNIWGYTDFSVGSNMMIVQAAPNCDGDGKIEASLPQGFDTTSSLKQPQYYEFKQTGQGNVTFNTVIAPYNRQSLGIHTVKLDTGVKDNIASAMIIERFNNSSLEKLVDRIVYYNSFESDPTERTVSGFADESGRKLTFETDAGNAVYHVAGDGSVDSFTLSKGTQLVVYDENGEAGKKEIAKVNFTKNVSDFSISYDVEKGTVSIETSDGGIIDGTTGFIATFGIIGDIKNVKLNGRKLSDDKIKINRNTVGNVDGIDDNSDNNDPGTIDTGKAGEKANPVFEYLPAIGVAALIMTATVTTAIIIKKKRK